METSLYRIFIVLFLVMIFLVLRAKDKKIRNSNCIDPMTIFSFGLFTYSSIGAADRIGMYKNDLITPLVFYISVLTGYMAFAIGYLNKVKVDSKQFVQSGMKFSFLPNSIKFSDKESIAMLLFFILIVAFNIEKFVEMIVNFGIGASYAEFALREARTSTSGLMQLLNFFFSLVMIGLPSYNMLKSGKISLCDILILFVYFVYSLVCGYRTNLLVIGIAFITYYNFRVRRIKLKALVLGSVIAVFFLVLVGHLREVSTLTDMADLYKSSGSSLYDVGASGEFSNTVETCFKYIELSSFNYGYSWLMEILMFIPTFIWPDRPLPLPEQYVLSFFPEAPAGYGKGWFVLTDGYMSFGVFGVMLEMYFAGMTLALLYNYFMKRKDSYFLMLMYVFLLVFVFTMIRSSFLGFMKNYPLAILPLIIIHHMFGKKKRKKVVYSR